MFVIFFGAVEGVGRLFIIPYGSVYRPIGRDTVFGRGRRRQMNFRRERVVYDFEENKSDVAQTAFSTRSSSRQRLYKHGAITVASTYIIIIIITVTRYIYVCVYIYNSCSCKTPVCNAMLYTTVV